MEKDNHSEPKAAPLLLASNIGLGIALTLAAGFLISLGLDVSWNWSHLKFLIGVVVGVLVSTPAHEGGHYLFRDGPVTFVKKWGLLGFKNIDGTDPSPRMAWAGPLMGVAVVLLTPALYFTESRIQRDDRRRDGHCADQSVGGSLI